MLTTFFNARIEQGARIGFSVVLSERVELEAGASIGHFNLIKGLSQLSLGEFASIGHLNWISGYPRQKSKRFTHSGRFPSLQMGKSSALTQFHRFDCSDAIYLGEYSIVAGYNTQVLTHSINLEKARQETYPVRVGAYAFVGTRSVLLPGAVLPRCSVLGAGAVLVHAYDDEYYLYGGVPAKPIKQIDKHWAYFRRLDGYIE